MLGWLRKLGVHLPREKTSEGEKIDFLLSEVAHINETLRRVSVNIAIKDVASTRGSFNYQWKELPTGIAIADDSGYMEQIGNLICRMTGLNSAWFPGKQWRALDAGLEDLHGLLSLGPRCMPATKVNRRSSEQGIVLSIRREVVSL